MPQQTKKLIDSIELHPQRPLIVCDVDEVAVHFLKGFESFLDRQGMWLDAASFALSGNVKYLDDDTPVDPASLTTVFADFFDAETETLDMISGASESLARLSGDCQIVMLTNLSHEYHAKRRVNLDSHNIPYPLVTNQGPKGPAVKRMVERVETQVFFIDDIPHYHTSVAEHAPDVHLIHFMQDDRFARHAAPVENAALKTGSWHEVERFVLDMIDG